MFKRLFGTARPKKIETEIEMDSVDSQGKFLMIETTPPVAITEPDSDDEAIARAMEPQSPISKERDYSPLTELYNIIGHIRKEITDDVTAGLILLALDCNPEEDHDDIKRLINPYHVCIYLSEEAVIKAIHLLVGYITARRRFVAFSAPTEEEIKTGDLTACNRRSCRQVTEPDDMKDSRYVVRRV